MDEFPIRHKKPVTKRYTPPDRQRRDEPIDNQWTDDNVEKVSRRVGINVMRSQLS